MATVDIKKSGYYRVESSDGEVTNHQDSANSIERAIEAELNGHTAVIKQPDLTVDLDISDLLTAQYDQGYTEGYADGAAGQSAPVEQSGITVVLNGPSTITIDVEAGDTYTELGARVATDVGPPFAWTDLDITVTGEVDLTTEGVYEIVYTATDDLGNTASETRTVPVINVPGISVVPPTPVEESVRAFPGAEGMAANSVGGRTGTPTVYVVSNLNDSGTGSFREACEATGPRFVTFTVSGNINVTSRFEINNPNITIAGQTSPGGICFTGWPLKVLTHNVVIRHMRFRRGSQSAGNTSNDGESIFISNAYNVMVDHCSISWGTDETCQITDNEGSAYGVTFSWCMIYEGLQDPQGNHGFAFNFSDKFSGGTAGDTPEGTIHHCYFGNFQNRQPLLRGQVRADFRNNVSYNWYRQQGLRFRRGDVTNGNAHANIVGNYFKQGTDGNSDIEGFASSDNDLVPQAGFENTIYVSNNEGEDTLGNPLWTVGDWHIYKEFGDPILSEDWRKLTPWDWTVTARAGGVAVTTTTMDAAYAATVVANCGATKPAQDSEDAAQITDYTNDTGSRRANVTYPDDFPDLATGAPSAPDDTNGDGIPDDWTTANMGGDSWNDTAPSGYLWIEEYINELAE